MRGYILRFRSITSELLACPEVMMVSIAYSCLHKQGTLGKIH